MQYCICGWLEILLVIKFKANVMALEVPTKSL